MVSQITYTLTRKHYLPYGIFGNLIDHEANQLAVTLEHAFDTNGVYLPIIPKGSYSCIRRLSPRFNCDLFMLQNVPGHDYVEIHWGNFNSDSSGCILLGETMSNSMITNSRVTFEAFMKNLIGIDEFTLSVLG